MENKILYKIYISGRVQGVGYRWSAAAEATSRGIYGIIRNLTDGKVYIEAEGYRDQLDSYVEWCRKGPRLSRVEKVDVISCPPVNYSSFRIEH